MIQFYKLIISYCLMDTTTQIVLLIMLTVLIVTLVVVGIMVVFILKDLRISIFKVNNILTNVEDVTKSVANGSMLFDQAMESVQSIISSVKNQAASPIGSIVGLFQLFQKLRPTKGGEKYGK